MITLVIMLIAAVAVLIYASTLKSFEIKKEDSQLVKDLRLLRDSLSGRNFGGICLVLNSLHVNKRISTPKYEYLKYFLNSQKPSPTCNRKFYNPSEQTLGYWWLPVGTWNEGGRTVRREFLNHLINKLKNENSDYRSQA